MAELAQAEVYTPWSLQLWRAMLDWFSFFIQILVQIVNGTPSMTQLLSYVGLENQSLFSSHFSYFKPLPLVELPEVNERETEQSVTAAPVHIGGGRVSLSVDDVIMDRSIDRLTVVLDMDETLVSAYERSRLSPIIRTRAIEAGLKWFELEFVSSDKEIDGKPKINYVTVFERPGLREFLRQVHEFADLVLFTAGLEGYARPLVDQIDVENRFSQRLYRPSTISTEYREHVKDLSCLSKDPCRIVIVDNNPFSFLLQPVNGIPCIPFLAEQPQDNQLHEVLLPLLRQLSKQRDVRPMLYDMYHMPEWFQRHGV
ncbi:carboxy-terminal domain RNA polymerase II polypeptide A small phosphatase 1-like [Impatiens glandulifera]|uniref:carboxy-terminal domain RNA polymerase II polypeptide A small phosphatase 1-like n=1 Tax=Impatiens glandulifera TaxID=253017 RepID=UPI001FB12F21|nr:carboxy-terminal domain RNA polymerase II polypeptide A small phosphatase 1-like [Impatiens glandulifera]